MRQRQLGLAGHMYARLLVHCMQLMNATAPVRTEACPLGNLRDPDGRSSQYTVPHTHTPQTNEAACAHVSHS